MKINLVAVLGLLFCFVSCSQTTVTHGDAWETAPRFAPWDSVHPEDRDLVLSDDDDGGFLGSALDHVLGVDHGDCEDYSGLGTPDLFVQRQLTGGFMKTGAGGGLSRMP